MRPEPESATATDEIKVRAWRLNLPEPTTPEEFFAVQRAWREYELRAFAE
jgi:hypothetical protein